MKRNLIFTLSLMTVLIVSGGAALQQSLGDLFQQAVHLEEVKGDLQAAIPLFQRVARESTDRSLAARAQLRIGLCYEKLGQDKFKQAQESFQKVLDTYPGETDLVKVARQKLNLLLEAQSAARGNERKMELRRILSIQGPQEYHQVSPDGRYVAYFDFGEMSPIIRELATGKTRKLKSKLDENEGYGEPVFFRWSPDSRSIVCNWWRDEPAFEFSDLRLLFADGSAPRRLFKDNYYGVYPLSWSSDGRHILASFYKSKDLQGTRMGIISTGDGSVRFLATPVIGRLGNSGFSPDNQYIAYDSPPDADPDNSNRDIFLIFVDEKSRVTLVAHPAHDAFLGWSPDGTRILFTSDRLGTIDLWTIAISNGRPAKEAVVIRRGIGAIEPAGITRPGSLYFMTSNRMKDIYVVEMDREKGKIVAPPTRMILPKQGNNWDPQYSPDGKFLAYIRNSSTGSQESSLCVLSLETKEERVFPLTAAARSLRWSPDGRSVYYSAYLPDNRIERFRMDLGTGQYSTVASEISNGPANSIQFIGRSKNGKSFYYAHSDKNKEVCRILARDANGIDRELYQTRCGLSWTSAVSPDGSRLAVVSRENQRDIIVLPTSGNGPSKVLFRFKHEGEHPTLLDWTADGRSIIFTKRDKEWGLWRISAEGGEPENLMNPSGQVEGMSVHPDGKHLAFSTLVPETEGKELWVMENFLPKNDPEKKHKP
jgi:Tol biopolymer transport system component